MPALHTPSLTQALGSLLARLLGRRGFVWSRAGVDPVTVLAWRAGDGEAHLPWVQATLHGTPYPERPTRPVAPAEVWEVVPRPGPGVVDLHIRAGPPGGLLFVLRFDLERDAAVLRAAAERGRFAAAVLSETEACRPGELLVRLGGSARARVAAALRRRP